MSHLGTMKMSPLELQTGLLQHLRDIAFFLEIRGEKPFKIRAFKTAPEILEALPPETLYSLIKDNRLIELDGIGKGIASVCNQYLKTGSSSEWDHAKGELPASLIELREVPGLGPKKIKRLYDALQIKSLAELEYACHENRIAGIPSFGRLTQEKILSHIQFIKAQSGKFLLSDVHKFAAPIQAALSKVLLIAPIRDYGRRQEIIHSIDFLISGAPFEECVDKISTFKFVSEFSVDKKSSVMTVKSSSEMKLHFHWCKKEVFGVREVFDTSGEPHWKDLQACAKEKNFELSPSSLHPLSNKKLVPVSSGERLYEVLELPPLSSEARELPLGRIHAESLVNVKDLKGVFHLHTTASDGVNSLIEMVEAARDRGWSFIGVSEHSKSSATYANGLEETRLKAQWKEIDEINRSFEVPYRFKIFRGIESDILKDGQLDYAASVLKQLDFVIASIHNRYGMTEMTKRLLRAIENPYTTMIGHLTGRLLLGRPPYDLDYRKIIDACIANETIMELNANPHRLDIDWRFLNEACERGLIISINPDAHSVHGYDDVHYGIWMARKAGISKESIFNTWAFDEIQKYLQAA